MAIVSTFNQEMFEKFLGWLDTDREIAGQKYEAIRLRLIKMFYARGCHLAEELADECLDRVIKKCDKIIDTYEGDPMHYCYGVAYKVFLEFKRKPQIQELSPTISQPEVEHEVFQTDYECLLECLRKLPPAQRELIIEYYTGEKQTKIEHRKMLEQKLKISNESLRIRAFRIRKSLLECILQCVKQKPGG